ncbi:hypothetical protein [Streptomyces lydicus]|uniref:hypothetical protein n=1 Tax=Streptomyces lydicus TaxID=47763 RepID=UPI00101137B3|nr:hypothetical protein [Streptomyces lydicus]MCZ1012348.1 hypothetical protein [Streptomyces lydicus]
MSHFSLLVALPPTSPDKVEAALEDVLAPFDEDTEVAPYRAYESGNAEDYWPVAACREDGQLPAEEPLTWEQVAEAVNARNKHDKDSSAYLHVDDDGRAYKVSTYNPNSKWDRWQIGGRWTGYFIPRADAAGDPRLLVGSPGESGDPCPAERVDGGPRKLLDLAAMRAEARHAAGEQFDRWQGLVTGLPEAHGWSAFLSRHEADPGAYPLWQAREEYGAQPQVKAARQSREFVRMDCTIDTFSPGRDAYMQQRADHAVPGYAYLGIDGVWQAPGRMGLFGQSTGTPQDQAEYAHRMNEQLDTLPPDTLLVAVDAVDCHI